MPHVTLPVLTATFPALHAQDASLDSCFTQLTVTRRRIVQWGISSRQTTSVLHVSFLVQLVLYCQQIAPVA